MKQPLSSPSFKALRKSRGGFTLLEIMMVVIIMGLLLATAIHAMKPQLEYAKVSRVKADIDAISTSLMTYQGMTGSLPSTSQGLNALVTQPGGDPAPKNWMQCMDKLPTDPWNNSYQYEAPGTHNPKSYDIYTTTPDGKQIGNWDN